MTADHPCLRLDATIARWAAGPAAAPGSLAARRTAALFDCPAAPLRPSDPALRELHLLPGAPVAAATEDMNASGASDATAWPAAERLRDARAMAPRGVLRVEWWPEGNPWMPDAVTIAALAATRPAFLHVVMTRLESLAPHAPTLSAVQAAGVPIAAEIVVQRGVNDSVDTLRALCLGLLRHGVRPYHLIDGAWMDAAERADAAHIESLVRSLRGWISGLAVPQWVEEGLDGRRRVRIPPYVTQLDDAGVEVINYEGRRLHYTNPPAER